MNAIDKLLVDVARRGSDVYAIAISCNADRAIRRFGELYALPIVDQVRYTELRIQFHGGARLQFAALDSMNGAYRFAGRCLTHIIDFDHHLPTEVKGYLTSTLRTPVEGWDVSGNWLYA